MMTSSCFGSITNAVCQVTHKYQCDRITSVKAQPGRKSGVSELSSLMTPDDITAPAGIWDQHIAACQQARLQPSELCMSDSCN